MEVEMVTPGERTILVFSLSSTKIQKLRVFLRVLRVIFLTAFALRLLVA